MTREMSQQRREVLALLEQCGPMSPASVASVLGMRPGTSRKLLFSMLSDGQVDSPGRGVYALPGEQTVTPETPENDVTLTPESREDIPILGESPSGVYVYVERLRTHIPNEQHLRDKGYR
jgi:hypothetical protein